MEYTTLLQMAIRAALLAGDEILAIYQSDFKVNFKSDATPVTQADQAASQRIIQELAHSNIPVLSEEGEHFPYSQREKWSHIWIVDPLDGTKEFVKRNGEFTVNIALVENGKPIIGVIYSPVFRHLYYAMKNFGSFKVNGRDVNELMAGENPDVASLMSAAIKLPSQQLPKVYTIVASRSHLSKEVSQRIKRAELSKGQCNVVNTGSSIKFCWLAEGLAHEYPRYGNTMEWDTAAGQCIVEQAGGKVIDQTSAAPIVYNREVLTNNNFIAFAEDSLQ